MCAKALIQAALAVWVMILCTISVSTTSAMIIIDDFTSGPVLLEDLTPNTGTEYATQSDLPTDSVIGGVRHLSLYGTSTPSSIEVVHGAMNLTSPNAKTYFYITYNGNPTSGTATPMLQLDLTNMEQFEITFSRVDRPFTFQIAIRSGTVFGYRSMTAEEPGVLVAPLSQFSNAHLINWSNINMVRLEAQPSYTIGGTTHTQSITDFRITPEPATFVPMLLGGMVVIGRRTCNSRKERR